MGENNVFDMQNLTFFAEGNTFTGSRSQGAALLRYRVAPDKENGQLLAWCWKEDKCFERAGGIRHREFLLNGKGLEDIQGWLGECWRDEPEEAGPAQPAPAAEPEA